MYNSKASQRVLHQSAPNSRPADYEGRNSTHYNQTTQSSNTTVYIPKEYVFFTHSLYIDVCEAKDFKKDQTEVFVWQGSAALCSESADFREISDYLFMAIFKNFGKDTKKIINNSFAETNLKNFWKEDKKSEKLTSKHTCKTKKHGKQRP